MPGGARSTAHSSTNAAPAREVQNTLRYFRLSRKLTSSGPAVSSGATSRHSRSPWSLGNSFAPLNWASSASVNGPPRSKKRGSAIAGSGRDQPYRLFALAVGAVGAVGAVATGGEAAAGAAPVEGGAGVTKLTFSTGNSSSSFCRTSSVTSNDRSNATKSVLWNTRFAFRSLAISSVILTIISLILD